MQLSRGELMPGAGVGLNLTSADRVVLVDPSWTSAADAQALAFIWKQHRVYSEFLTLRMDGFCRILVDDHAISGSAWIRKGVVSSADMQTFRDGSEGNGFEQLVSTIHRERQLFCFLGWTLVHTPPQPNPTQLTKNK